MLGNLTPEHQREIRLAEHREQRAAEEREAAVEAKVEARIERALRDGQPHGLAEVLVAQAAADAAEDRKAERTAKARRQARLAEAEAANWQAKATGRPVGHEEILSRYFASAAGPVIPNASALKPSPAEQELRRQVSQHEHDVIEQKRQTGKLRDAIVRLHGKLSKKGIDPI